MQRVSITDREENRTWSYPTPRFLIVCSCREHYAREGKTALTMGLGLNPPGFWNLPTCRLLLYQCRIDQQVRFLQSLTRAKSVRRLPPEFHLTLFPQGNRERRSVRTTKEKKIP